MNSGLYFSLNLFADFHTMWQFDFMRHAFQAGTIVAVVAGIMGYFVVLRNSSFAADALSHMGFTGAAGASLIGVNPLIGFILFTTCGAVTIATLGRRAAGRDVNIGVVLAFMMGLGVLFISLYKGYATEAYSLLFGEILGISSTDVVITFIAGLLLIAVVAILYRPLLFSSLDEEVAEAKGVSIFGIGIAFMVLVGIATSIAVQVVGVLLIFALMVTPAAVALRLAKRPEEGIIISVIIALTATWVGLFLSFYLAYPVSFFITAETFTVYVVVRLLNIIRYSKIIRLIR